MELDMNKKKKSEAVRWKGPGKGFERRVGSHHVIVCCQLRHCPSCT